MPLSLPPLRPALALLLALPLCAAPTIDLSRDKPVPADTPIPIADFFRPTLLRSPTINRSGTHLAALISAAEDRYSLLVYDIATRKFEVASIYGDRDVYYVDWQTDDRLLFGLSTEKLYAMALCSAQVGNLTRWYPVLQYGGARLLRVPEANPLQPLVWMRRDFETSRDEGVSVVNTTANTGPLIDLLAANVRMGEYETVRDQNNRHLLKTFPVPPGGVTTGYLCDKDDALAFAFTAKDGIRTLHRLEAGAWVKCPVDLDEIDVLIAGDRPGELLVAGPRQDGRPRPLQVLDATTGKLGEILLQDPEYDFSGSIYRDPVSRKVLGVRYHRNGPRMVWFDPNFLAIQKAIDGLFPGQVAQILDWNRAATRFVIGRYNDRQPMIYDWVDLAAKTAGPIKQSQPWIDPARMQPMQIFKFKTRDGHLLDAYLTLPAGASKANPAPMIVLSHGGPYLRDTWGYDGEVQFLASRGYAVLQTNYRGSTGYNWAFPREDEWDFVKMHEDVTSATKAAFATKVIDRNRVAIMGGSFGGYLAVFGITDEPDLYKCAVTIDGVYDWADVTQQERYWQYDSAEYGWLIRRLGDPTKNKAKFDAISPIRRADRIKVPVFIAHGKDDDVVEIGQARALISALDRNHVPHDTMLVSREGHGMGHLENQVRLYERIEAFLAKYLAPAAPTEAPPAPAHVSAP